MTIRQRVENIKNFILHWQWRTYDVTSLSRLRKALRILTLAVYEFLQTKCPIRASALTLAFVFSLAPALALGFSVAKGLNVQERVRPLIYRMVTGGAADIANDTQGQTAQPVRNIMDTIFNYVEQTNVQAMGAIGLFVLLYTSYTVLRAIERTMNEIWGVRKNRTLLRRVVDYLAVLFIFPLILTIAALVIAALQSAPVAEFLDRFRLGQVVELLAYASTLIITFVAFWFLYSFFPNTTVPLLSSAIGALVAAFLWWGLQWLYVQSQVGVAKYNAIYGTFAAVPIFLLWLYISWNIILFGAELSFAHASQSEFEYGGLAFTPSASYRRQLALGMMIIITRAFMQEKTPPSSPEISEMLAAPVRVVRDVLADLQNAAVINEVTAEDFPRYAPRTPLVKITVGRVFDAVDSAGDEPEHSIKALAAMGVGATMARDQHDAAPLRNITMDVLSNEANNS